VEQAVAVRRAAGGVAARDGQPGDSVHGAAIAGRDGGDLV